MSTIIPQVQIRAVQRRTSKQKLHGAMICICVIALLLLVAVLAVYGSSYYLLDRVHRPLSPLHSRLKPSGEIGLHLGMAGFILFALVYLYPLRKCWPWLGQKGKSGHWLDFHVMLGLAAPVIITFHSSFKIQGFAGTAYWIMIALAISGIIGRYLYAQIPRSLGAAMMSLHEMEDLRDRLAQQLAAQNVLPAPELERCLRLPDVKKVESMPALRAALLMLKTDLVLPPRIWGLRRRASGNWAAVLSLGGVLATGKPELEKAILTARKQASLSKKILFLAKAQRVFYFWHVVHRPFSYTFAILVLIHVSIAVLLGFY